MNKKLLIIQITLLVLLGFFSAWEEVQQLVQRGSWRVEDYGAYLFWYTDWQTIWKNFDSHHVAFGGFIAILGLSLYYIKLTKIWQIPIFWLLFFYIRNIFMHIVFKNDPIWGYLWGNIL